MSVPIEGREECADGAMAVLNIDAARAHVFPEQGTAEFDAMMERIGKLIVLLRRMNRLADGAD